MIKEELEQLGLILKLYDTARKYARECAGKLNPDIRDTFAFINGAEWMYKQLKQLGYDL